MKRNPNHLRGFSVAALLVAAGMMSGLALLLSELSKRQMVVQRKAETGVEIAELSQQITRTMQNGSACFNTIAQVGGPITDGTDYSIPSVMGRPRPGVPTPPPLLTVNNTYRNRLVLIESIDLTDVTIPTTVPPGTVGELNLRVTFVKNSQAITGYNKVIKKFPLAVELDSGNNVTGCISLQDGALNVAKRDICPQMGGTYDDTNQTCISSLIGQECPELPGPPPEQQFIQKINPDYTLDCAPIPPNNPHPPGFNCYLLTTYSFYSNKRGPRYPFQANDLDSGYYKIAHLWRLKPVSRSGYIDDFHSNVTALGNYDGKETCETGYDDKFYRPSRDDDPVRTLVLHYCCR